MPEMARDNRVAVVFYDAARKVQLRMNGTARVHANDALSQQRWAASRPSSLRCFLGAQPGATSQEPTSGLPPHVEGREPEAADLLEGRANFGVLQVAVQQLEWLHLHTRGQRRALFIWAGSQTDSVCTMQWLNP